MGMDEATFYDATPKYYRLRLFGMRTAQEQQYRNQWTIARWQVATIIAPHLKKPIEPIRLMRFPWERPPIDIVATVAKYKDIFAKLTPPAEA